MDTEAVEKLYELAIRAHDRMLNNPSFTFRLECKHYFDAFVAAISAVTGNTVPEVIKEITTRIRNRTSSVEP